jgi:ribonuclease III
MVDWQELQRNIGISFREISFLQQAFVHSSFASENPDYPLHNNERLEFLGDAVLNFTSAEKIFHEFPDLPEGKLTELRVSLIREETLALLASELNLGDYLLLGKGEEATGGRSRQTSLADAFEALIGAIFLDQGLDTAKGFIIRQLRTYSEMAANMISNQNFKAKLQEFTQAAYKQLPTYRLVEESGPGHDKNFTIEVSLGDKLLGTGSGKTKKAAEMEAAREGCATLFPDGMTK